MASDLKSEENFPLLLLFVEDDNKIPHKKNGVFVEKNRYSKISEGAGYVFTQWPEHISSNWISGCLFFLFFLVLILMLIAASIRPIVNPNCISTDANISNPGIFLVYIGDELDNAATEELKEIIENYPNYRIEIFFLKHHLKVSNSLQSVRISKRSLNKTKTNGIADDNNKISSLNINIGKKEILKHMTYNPIKFVTFNKSTVTLSELSKKHRITSLHKSIRKFFAFTQLHNSWKKLRDDVLEFAARAILLWENGGISFKLTKGKLNQTQIRVYKSSSDLINLYDEEWNIRTLIQSNSSSFEQLPLGIVNIDDSGLHMETKTPCHAYFAQMILNLKHANKNSTVESIIRATLKSFCLSGAVNDDYCLKFLKGTHA